ncbi:MAG: hypothetical protein AAF078_14675, partial [Planctomycetota bacterium]
MSIAKPLPFRAALLSLGFLLAPWTHAQADPHRLVDSAHESPIHLGFTAADGAVVSTPDRRLESLNFTDRKVGDFSLEAFAKGQPMRIGLTPGPFIAAWDLTDRDRVQLWSRVVGADADEVAMELIDANGVAATHAGFNVPADGGWHRIDLALSEFSADAPFDRGAVVAMQTVDALPAGATIAFDGAVFTSASAGEAPLGITDMTYAQRIAEAEQTRRARQTAGMRKIADFVP